MLLKQIFPNRAIARLFWAQLLSQMGDKLMLVGIAWVVSERFSPQWVSWFVGAGAFPHLLSLSLAGPGIARLGGPLRTVIVTDWIRTLIFVAGAAVVWRSEGNLLLAVLFALTLASNALGALFNPAIFSLPADLAEGDPVLLQKATALIESCLSLSAILAPLLSTLMYKWTGLAGLLLLNGLSYGVAAWLESGIELPGKAAAAAPESAALAFTASSEAPVTAWQAMREEPVLMRMLAGFFLMNLFLGPILAFLPIFASGVYGGTINTLAWLEGAMGAGTAVGTVALSLVPLKGGPRAKVLGSIAMVAVCYGGFALSRGVVAGAVAVGFLGLFLAVTNVVMLNVFQTRPRPQAVPAIMGWVNLISVASLPLSMSVVGGVLQWAPATSVAQACAAVLGALVFGAFLVR